MIWWNDKNKELWFKHYDVVDPSAEEPLPEDSPEPVVAIYTDTYYLRNLDDPGTSEKPNMIHKTVPGGERVALFLIGGHIVSYCEKVRDANKVLADDTGKTGSKAFCGSGDARVVDPKACGVYFDDGRGEFAGKGDGGIGCVYTDKFCTRMGMKHKSNLLKKPPSNRIVGATVDKSSEMLFGSTITRGIQRGFHNLFGLECLEPCKTSEYCEGRKCHKKKGTGAFIGPGASWKCLSGHEAYWKCVECRDKDEDCDGLGTNVLSGGRDCTEKGSCFCQPGSKGPKANQCWKKRENCLSTDKWKCCDYENKTCPTKESQWDEYGCDHSKHCKNGWCDIVVGQINRCRKHESVKNRKNGEFCNEKDDQCASGLCAHHMCRPRIKACTQVSPCAWDSGPTPQRLSGTDHRCNRSKDCVEEAYCKKVAGQPILAANAITSETVRMESTATRIMSARAVYVHTTDAHHASRPVCR